MTTLGLGLCLLLPAGAFAGPDAKVKSITGCLTKSDKAGVYILTQEITGAKVEVRGSADLDKHSGNHKVKVTGTSAAGKAEEVLEVTAVEHISDTCAAPR